MGTKRTNIYKADNHACKSALCRDASLNKKIQKAYNSLKEASELIVEIKGNVREETKKVNSLRKEYERYLKLAGVKKDEAEAIIQQIEDSRKKGRWREHLINLAIKLIAGMLMLVLSISISNGCPSCERSFCDDHNMSSKEPFSGNEYRGRAPICSDKVQDIDSNSKLLLHPTSSRLIFKKRNS